MEVEVSAFKNNVKGGKKVFEKIPFIIRIWVINNIRRF